MTATLQTATTPALKRAPMTSLRKMSLAAGILYLITFVSIPTISLYGNVKDPNYLLGTGSDSPALIGGLLEIIVGLAGIGTAVMLYPVIKRQHQGIALGFVAARILEGATIFSGVVSLLSIVTLHRSGAGADALVSAHVLTAQYNWMFTVGQALIPGVNALLLGSLLYRSRLVPRILPVLGLIGGPLIFASVAAKYFGLYDEHSVLSGLGAAPVAIWEFSLGAYLVVKGFRSCRITSEMTDAR